MIEYPEAVTLAEQLNQEVMGKVIQAVNGPTYEHKFTWFHGDITGYGGMLEGHKVEKTEAFGIYVEINFEGGIKLNFNDGVNVRLIPPEAKHPVKYQLLIEFTDGYALAFSVAMYGGFCCHMGDLDNPYYLASRNSISPMSEEFSQDYFMKLFDTVKPSMSAKGFLATEQRIPGLGNGVLQDILLKSGIHPKRKVAALGTQDKERMFQGIKSVMKEMIEQGGRDTEKDLHGRPGGYVTLLSQKTWKNGCPYCGGIVEKQAFLGGSIYFCGTCQPITG